MQRRSHTGLLPGKGDGDTLRAGAMIIFSSTAAAIREGFQVDELDLEHSLFIVIKDVARSGIRMRMRAFARASVEELALRAGTNLVQRN